MGRKGVSKRKPVQTKSKLSPGGETSGTVSTVMKAAASQPVKLNDTEKAAPPASGGEKSASGGKKNKKH